MDNERTTTEEEVTCELCLREVPVSEAQCAEAADYFLYFCGADCFAKWTGQEQGEAASKTV